MKCDFYQIGDNITTSYKNILLLTKIKTTYQNKTYYFHSLENYMDVVVSN